MTIWVKSSSNVFWRRWFCFHWRFDDIDVEISSASKYVAGKHRIFTTMNISGSRVIHIVIVLCLLPPFQVSRDSMAGGCCNFSLPVLKTKKCKPFCVFLRRNWVNFNVVASGYESDTLKQIHSQGRWYFLRFFKILTPNSDYLLLNITQSLFTSRTLTLLGLLVKFQPFVKEIMCTGFLLLLLFFTTFRNFTKGNNSRRIRPMVSW